LLQRRADRQTDRQTWAGNDPLCEVACCTAAGFKKKEFRGKLAIAITANFINHNTKVEASVEEISGVSYIFNQKCVIILILVSTTQFNVAVTG